MPAGRPETRVAFLSERSDLFGGGQASLRDLAAALGRTPYRPLVVVPGPGALTEELEARGVEWTALPLPRFVSGWGAGAAAALVRLRRLVRQRGIHLLHSDSPRTALYGGCAARLASRRHVFHARASRPSSGVADSILLFLSDRVIAVSRAAAARSSALRASSRTRVVLTGLPAIDFLPRVDARLRLDLPPDAFVCAVLGRVERDKGREEALQALSAVREAIPGAILVYLGACDPGDPWTRTCALRAAAAGMSGAVRLAGPVPRAASLLKAFDLLLHPSHHEALPRVVIEAQFAEIPVVAAAVGGVPEIIDSGVNGILVPPRDARALGHAAAALARDPASARRLARAGEVLARERFGLARMTAEITAIYDEILREEAAPATPGSRGGATGRATEATS